MTVAAADQDAADAMRRLDRRKRVVAHAVNRLAHDELLPTTQVAHL